MNMYYTKIALEREIGKTAQDLRTVFGLLKFYKDEGKFKYCIHSLILHTIRCMLLNKHLSLKDKLLAVRFYEVQGIIHQQETDQLRKSLK